MARANRRSQQAAQRGRGSLWEPTERTIPLCPLIGPFVLTLVTDDSSSVGRSAPVPTSAATKQNPTTMAAGRRCAHVRSQLSSVEAT